MHFSTVVTINFKLHFKIPSTKLPMLILSPVLFVLISSMFVRQGGSLVLF